MKVGWRAPAPVTIVLQLATNSHGMTVSSEVNQVSINPTENQSVVNVSAQMLDNLLPFD